MAETSEDPDARRAKIAIAALVGLVALVALLTAVFGLTALYISAAILAPLYLVGLILLSLDSSNPEHGRVQFSEDEEQEKA
ncbi:MAG: hypothetical protein SNJ63_00310 [Sphingomonadaceae bacterium]